MTFAFNKIAGSGLVCSILALALAGCGTPKSAEADESAASKPGAQLQARTDGSVVLGPDAPELKQMKIESVREMPIPADELTAPARIEVNPNRVGHAVLPAPGRIVHVMVKMGDSVTRGQPVVSLESPTVAEAETSYMQADASVRQAELALTKAEADLARLADLFDHQAVAQKEVMAARTTTALGLTSLEQAKTGRDQARRRLELLGLKAGQLQQQITITAPVSGKVLAVSVVDGEFRNETDTPIVTIADLSRVWATSEVPESKIRYCRVGGTADLELIAYPHETFSARVTRIADTVDSETRTIKVSAELENAGGRLRPEMYGSLHYEYGTLSMPWVPEAAVFRMNEQDFVFVEQSPGHFKTQQVELGKRHDGGFAVSRGLKLNERVVTQGSVYLKAAL